MKRIGFVDYRLDNYHAEVYLKAIRGPLAARGYEVAGATAIERGVSLQWAEERALSYFDSVEALNEAADYFIILAPSNPEKHWAMCQETLPFGKTTFVDKTFAPDEATARAIFALADSCGAAIQTTSALRNTAIQSFVRDMPSPVDSLLIFSSGPSFAEYGIHPVELAVSCLGHQAERILRIGPAAHPQWLLQFHANRNAIIDFNPNIEIPFSAIITSEQGYEPIEVDGASLFLDAAGGILDFFDAGRALVDRRESLMVRRILDVAQGEPPFYEFVELHDRIWTTAVPAPHWQAAVAIGESSRDSSSAQRR